MEFRPVRGFPDALRMARIRNEVRGYMTRDTSEIGPLRQWRWWRRRYLPGVRMGRCQAWLLLEGGQVVGYGTVAHSQGGRWWVAGGLVEAARGKGLGRLLFRYLTNEAMVRSGSGTAWLEVRASNVPALRLYTSLGYSAVGTDWRESASPVLVMRAQEASTAAAKPPGRGG